MGKYDDEVASAEADIREAGALVTLIRTTTTAGANDWDNGVPGEVEVPDVPAVFLNFNDQESQTQRLNDNDMRASDRKVLIPAGYLNYDPPDVDDILEEVGGTRWTIKWVQELSPDGQDILYTLRARR